MKENIYAQYPREKGKKGIADSKMETPAAVFSESIAEIQKRVEK